MRHSDASISEFHRSLSGARLDDAEESFCGATELTVLITQLYTADQLVNSTDDVCRTDRLHLQRPEKGQQHIQWLDNPR